MPRKPRTTPLPREERRGEAVFQVHLPIRFKKALAIAAARRGVAMSRIAQEALEAHQDVVRELAALPEEGR